MVLTFVNGLEKPNPTDALKVGNEFAEMYESNAQVKAFSTLNQLTRKGLIKKKIFATVERGNVAVFFPRSWQDGEVSTLLFR